MGLPKHLKRCNLRQFLANLAGASDVALYWTPTLPILYINNVKAGCSTIKQSLKQAQANEYGRTTTAYRRVERPEQPDDCLKNENKTGLRLSTCRQRFLISCVRNPFARALSGYLDKAQDHSRYGLAPSRSFEEHLANLSQCQPETLDRHFKPQHINLDFPRVDYDAIFYLEDLSSFSRFLNRLSPDSELETYRPHARFAVRKIREHYTDSAIRFVQNIFDEDFSFFGYSRRLDDVGVAPGAFIAGRQVVAKGQDSNDMFLAPRHSEPCRPIKTKVLFHTLRDMRII